MMTVAFLVAALAMTPGQETGTPGQNRPPTPANVPVEKPKDTPPKPAGTRTYTDKGLGLAFEYPANWTYEKPSKNRAGRFLIPIEGTSARGELQVIDLEYRATPEAFQDTQATMIGRLNQQLLRQWQIEILGVPLLMTKLKSVGEDGERTTLVGLLYSSTPRKFNFRLSAPSENFEAVEYPWQGVLETLRTTSGALPTAEGTPPPKTDPTPVKEVRTEIGPRLKNVTYRGPVVATMAFGGTSGTIALPQGWTAEPSGDGTLRLSNPKFATPLTAKGYLTQADNPTGILTTAGVEGMKRFAKIDRRYDPIVPTTRTGASSAGMIRIGSDAAGVSQAEFEGVVTQDNLFVHIAGFGAAPTKAKSKEQIAIFNELLTSLRVDPKPTTGE